MPQSLVHAACFFLVLAAYFVLRPLRDELGVQGGVDALPWLFTATLVVTLVLVPVHGWFVARVTRRALVPVLYLVVAGLLLVSRAALASDGGPWAARGFFVLLSVVNLFLVSGFWAAMSDSHAPEQAGQRFGWLAAGGTLGALTGPLLVTLLAPHLAVHDLVYLSCGMLSVAALLLWRTVTPSDEAPARLAPAPWEGLRRVVSEPRLRWLATLVIGHALAGTLIYLAQARLVAAEFSEPALRVAFFARLDLTVNALTVLIQLGLTGLLLARAGVLACLVVLPLVLSLGFSLLAVTPVLAVVAGLTVTNRVLHFALMKPAREVLFTWLPVRDRYRARNALDTLVYRATDALGAWLVAGLTVLGAGVAGVALVGVPLSLAWAWASARAAESIQPEAPTVRTAEVRHALD
jgi:AAA family ATP:ADP antiporter